MKYVLLLIFAGYNRVPVMHDFDSKESCTVALKEINQTYEEKRDTGRPLGGLLSKDLIKSVCIPK